MNVKTDQQTTGGSCWREKGTWSSSPSCEQLKVVAHCRNCEVFKQAAQKIFAERHKLNGNETAPFSIEDLIEKEKVIGDVSALPFRIGSTCLAVPSENVVTITDTVAVHAIPYNKSEVLKGLAAINNEIYSYLNLSRLINLDEGHKRDDKKYKRGLYKRILVVDLGSKVIAFHVDEVYQIYHYFEKSIQALTPGSAFQTLIKGLFNNEGLWDDDCYLLNLASVQAAFEKIV